MQHLGYIALLPAIGFLLIYLLDLRKQGAETFGQPIWWDYLRPVHALFYFLFAYAAIVEKDVNAWKYLLVDVIVGLSGFIANRLFIY